MAQINVVSNTEDNTLTVSINGSTIPNVTDVGTYRDVDSDGNVIGFYIRITAKELVSEGLWKIVEYYSYGSPQAMAAEASGNAVYNDSLPDFVGIPAKTKAQTDIENFFTKK
jgi:hypothetical protein